LIQGKIQINKQRFIKIELANCLLPTAHFIKPAISLCNALAFPAAFSAKSSPLEV